MPDPTQPKTGDEIMATVAIKDGKVVMLPPDAVALTRETREQVRQWVPQRQLREYDRLVNWLQAYEAALTAAEQRAEQAERAASDAQDLAGKWCKERDDYKTLAHVGRWHNDCRPNRNQAAQTIRNMQDTIDKMADAVSESNRGRDTLREQVERMEERYLNALQSVVDVCHERNDAQQERDTLRAQLDESRRLALYTEERREELATQVGRLVDELHNGPRWQDIATAPKIVRVLLLCPERGVVAGRWNNDSHAKQPRPYWANDLEHLFGVTRTRADQPTHWMPLPDAPVPQEGA